MSACNCSPVYVINTYTYICVCIYMHIDTYIHVYMCAYIYVYLCIIIWMMTRGLPTALLYVWYIHVYINICKCMHMYQWIYTNICVCIYIYVYVWTKIWRITRILATSGLCVCYIRIHTGAYVIYACQYVYMRIYTWYIYIYAYIHIYIYIYMYMCIYMYTNKRNVNHDVYLYKHLNRCIRACNCSPIHVIRMFLFKCMYMYAYQ